MAAPGQMSMKEIHQVRHQIGCLSARRFFLFGSPISQSFSPIIHSTGFQTLGFPYTYHLCESQSPDELKQVLFHESFGGASVTIPLKESIQDLLHEKTEAAQAIGAVNTIFLRKHPAKGSILVGDNTDYLGILGPLRQKLTRSTKANLHELNGMVLGAGGTCRASVYALARIPSIRRILIVNRTLDRAQRVIDSMRPHLSDSIEVSCSTFEAFDAHSQTFQVIISTLPRPAMELCVHWISPFLKASGDLCALVDLVYGADTPLRQLGRAVLGEISMQSMYIGGESILLEQGLLQFERWTGLPAPRQAITDTFMKAIQLKYGLRNEGT